MSYWHDLSDPGRATGWSVVARDLLQAFSPAPEPRCGPVWVVLFAGTGGAPARVAVREHPNGLAGWVAPAHCRAVGVVATGRVVQGSAGRPTTAEVELCCVVSRDGQVGWAVEPVGSVPDVAPEQGRILDCLRRCFGLPTPPQAGDATILFDLVWLLSIVQSGDRAGAPLSWAEATRLRPTVGPAAGPAVARDRRAGPSRSWEDIRVATARGAWPDGPVPPDLAGWMDSGMFARSVLEALPDLATLIPAAAAALTAPGAARLRDRYPDCGYARVDPR